MYKVIALQLLVLFSASQALAADPHAVLAEPVPGTTVEEILDSSEAPVGVVFEIYSSSDDTLQWALPLVRQNISDLRAKFPGVQLAVVTHGLELLSLLKQYHQYYPSVHEQSRELTGVDNVPLHIDAGYARAHGAYPHEFLDNVDVTPDGPARVRSYQGDGYEQVVIWRGSTGAPAGRDACPMIGL